MNKDLYIRIRCDAEFIKMVDEWRDRQTARPNRSETIRALVTKAIVEDE